MSQRAVEDFPVQHSGQTKVAAVEGFAGGLNPSVYPGQGFTHAGKPVIHICVSSSI
jgi:hypothetical protein